jgi:hypothetical protein
MKIWSHSRLTGSAPHRYCRRPARAAGRCAQGGVRSPRLDAAGSSAAQLPGDQIPLPLEHSAQGCALVPVVGSLGGPEARAVRGAAAVVHAAHPAGWSSAVLRDVLRRTPVRLQAPCLKRKGHLGSGRPAGAGEPGRRRQPGRPGASADQVADRAGRQPRASLSPRRPTSVPDRPLGQVRGSGTPYAARKTLTASSA